MKLNIAHCIASMDKNAGGTTTAVLDILKEQSGQLFLEIFTLNSENQIEIPIKNLKLISEDKSFLDYSVGLGNKLANSNVDLFHGHALWNFPIHQMSTAARKKGKPYIISIHGMLEPWSLQQSKLKKKVAMNLYQFKDLRKASCLHATAYSEAENIRSLGFKNPIAIIPNGINLLEYPFQVKSLERKKRKLLFLSRIHHKKGIEILIDAWSKIDLSIKNNWEVEIAGNGEEEYIKILQQKINNARLNDEIKITGPHFGKEKINTYQSADLFVLPTYSENFGMVIAEALSCGIPVITTKGTPWKDLEEYNAGSWIDIGIEPLRNTLETYLTKDSKELQQMGMNGRKLVEDKYSIESVGEKFKHLYNWILNKAEKPEFVI